MRILEIYLNNGLSIIGEYIGWCRNQDTGQHALRNIYRIVPTVKVANDGTIFYTPSLCKFFFSDIDGKKVMQFTDREIVYQNDVQSGELYSLYINLIKEIK